MKIFKMYTSNINDRFMDEVIDTLTDGGIVIYPTDTLYAIGIRRICRRADKQDKYLKGREQYSYELKGYILDIGKYYGKYSAGRASRETEADGQPGERQACESRGIARRKDSGGQSLRRKRARTRGRLCKRGTASHKRTLRQRQSGIQVYESKRRSSCTDSQRVFH